MKNMHRVLLVIVQVWVALHVMMAHATTVDLTKLPLGDNLLSTAPKVGYLWPCITGAGGGGAFAQGPWFNADGTTYDLTAKVSVDGAVAWSNQYTSFVSGSSRVFSTNDLPNHTTGIYPIASSDDAYLYDRNPNSISTQQIQFSLTANPSVAAQASCAPGAVGILLTGAVLFNAVDAGDRDAVAHEVQDSCQGHPQQSGVYHYHSVSTCSNDSTASNQHSALIGYAVDGFGIYGHRGENGVEVSSADLDECHGHSHTITWDGVDQVMYHYHATWDFPYTVGCMRGSVDPAVVMAISNGTSTNTSTPSPTSVAHSPTPSGVTSPTPTHIYTPIPTQPVTPSPSPIPIASHDVIQTVEGEHKKDSAGAAVAYLGDVNGDGFGDYAMGMPLQSVMIAGKLLKEVGAVWLISGKDKTILHVLHGDNSGDHFGSALAGGKDVDGDNVGDVVVGAYLADNAQGVKNIGSIKVFSGADATLLYEKWGTNTSDYFGYSVALVDDANGDHNADVVVGAYGTDHFENDKWLKDTGSVTVFIGKTGETYRTFFGISAKDAIGYSVSDIGDVNHDDVNEIAVGAPYTDYFSLKDSGSVMVYSPYTNKAITRINGFSPSSGFGLSVSGVGDVNRDGYPDMLIGSGRYDAPIYDVNHIQTGTIKDAGGAFVYSSATWRLLYEITGENSKDYAGSAVASAGDINNDGYDDLVVGAYGTDVLDIISGKKIKDAGSISVYSGVTGKKLFTHNGMGGGDYFGAAVSAGDINHDEHNEIMVGAVQDDVVISNVIIKDAGSVSIISPQQ